MNTMDAEAIKKNHDIMRLIGSDTTLKKVAATEGGEFSGPCPFCHGTDRFSVQPNHQSGGRWFCRHCGGNKWHSVIDYVMIRDRTDFIGAINKLSDNYKELRALPKSQNNSVETDRQKWQDAANRFFKICMRYLWNSEGKESREYLHSRGLTDDTITKWMLGFYPWDGYLNASEWGLPPGRKMKLQRGIVIPCFDLGFGAGDIRYIKLRCEDGEPKYKLLSGSKQWLFGGFTCSCSDIAYLFESELDVLLAWQSGLNLGYISLPTSWKLQPDYYQYFQYVTDLIVCQDNDAAGEEKTASLCKKNKKFHRANPLHSGKDLTEFYQTTNNIDDVFHWLYQQLNLIPRG